jgi:hypothetical protein
MKKLPPMCVILLLALDFSNANANININANSQNTKVDVTSTQSIPSEGRLYLVFSPSAEEEPRFYSAWPTSNVEPLFAKDISGFKVNETHSFTHDFIGFPYKKMAQIPSNKWYVQAIYDTDFLDSRINSPLNFYSNVVELDFDGNSDIALTLNLEKQIAKESLPKEAQFLKFDKVPSQLLSDFWQNEMFLRVGVILPKTYYDNPSHKFPVVFDIGGYHARYTRAKNLYENDAFKAFWFSDDAPQMVMIFLDGEAPLGDSYQIDSQNNGHYGEANMVELLPYLTEKYKLVDDGNSRFTTGCSTGGWVSLALQLFYPEQFNGAWSFSADGVDFKYFQLVDIYSDNNAFINEHGNERPSYRAKDGEIIFSIQREIMMENVIGREDSFAFSGGQWGGWNAVFGPKKQNGQPSVIWDPVTGEIDKEVAKAWEDYDLRLYTQNNWATLGPKLAGKLHIWMGDMDNFYLNNAMNLYQNMLEKQEEPKSDAVFTWERGVGHCDYKKVPMLKKTLLQMQQRISKSTN